ncbi:hypothetical protein RvY_17265 [Ramazzottius varieornatus]|uniref:Uncharacterized protein n=1 Tax=Ramazzottius varieornatus TaxID=947166 RepID=A0A1D1W1J2_RAMVA|nr:hypothetical protein RvY_17265 [Ramazzottius varieornatus]
MKKELPGRSRTQSKEFVLAPVSTAPASCTLLDTMLSSFAYIAMNLLKDPLFKTEERYFEAVSAEFKPGYVSVGYLVYFGELCL